MINVAIVEDDFRVANIHEKFLNQIYGVAVVGKAHLAVDALKIIEENHVDLLLVDIYMPDKLGTDLIKEIKIDYPNLNFIVITAVNNMELLNECLKHGIFYYLIKPVTMDKFTEVINNFINRKKLLDSKEPATQDFIDQVLKNISTEIQGDDNLPKGINSITLKKTFEIIEIMDAGVTAEEVGIKMNASTTTARRYLQYLVSIKKAKVELEYGIVGRPERKYHI